MQPSFSLLMLVGMGGWLGTMARYLVVVNVGRGSISFPVGTLVVNLIGCFIIALVAGVAEKTTLISPETRLFLATGICGGFTTFSALMYEAGGLLEEGEFWYAGIYVSASFIGGLVALYLGFFIVNKWV